MACAWPTPPLGPPACSGAVISAAPTTLEVVLGEGELWVVNACAVSGATIAGEASTASCGDSGAWAASDVAGAHTLRVGGSGAVWHARVRGAIPAPLRGGASAAPRSAAGGTTLALCMPASILGQAAVAVRVAASVAPDLALVAVTPGRAASALSATSSDAVLAASMRTNLGANGTLLFRAGGAGGAPANVTVWWPGTSPVVAPSAAVVMPGIADGRWQVLNTGSAGVATTQPAYYITMASQLAAADAVAGMARVAAALQEMGVLLGQSTTTPPAAPAAPPGPAEGLWSQVSVWVVIVSGVISIGAAIVGVISYYSSSKQPQPKGGGAAAKAALDRGFVRLR